MEKVELVITSEMPNKNYCFAGKVFVHKRLLNGVAHKGGKFIALVENTKKGISAVVVGQEKVDNYLSIMDKWQKIIKDNPNMKLVGSCNKDISQYLCIEGTENEISYFGKPLNSYRISDHWNWYSPKAKGVIQCELVGVETPKEECVFGCRELHIARYESDNKYHIVA